MTETKLPSMVAQLENVITKFFYAKDGAELRRRASGLGLQSPVWLWTHEEEPAPTASASLRDGKDVRKTCRLMEWMVRNQVDLSTIAVLVPLSMKAALKEELAACLQRWLHDQDAAPSPSLSNAALLPVVLAHHELTAMNRRDKTTYSYEAVVYVFGLPPGASSLPEAVGQSDCISEALGAARRAFVLIMDGGWAAASLTAKWPQWRNFLEKLRDEQPPISAAPPVANAPQSPGQLPSLAGSSLPLCCARHPNHRQLEYGLTPVAAECRRLCLRHYDCGVAHHLCREQCHPSRRHAACPFACTKTLPCGHDCLLACSGRCNCYEVVERPLPCAHQVVLGLDPATLEPIYAAVAHVFKGVCADAGLPCAVEFATECARCLGPMTARCFEAQAHGHTAEGRTMLCPACQRAERELRAQILGEVLYGAEAEKKRLKVELQRSLHQQRKAATQGLFTPGVKVEVTDAIKCVPPLLADDDFPGVAFADMDDAGFYTRMAGAYGTFISSHVDVMDRSELRNLVRLPDGNHVLVTDGGLRMIRALTTGVTGAIGAPLLLTGAAAAPAADGGAGNSPEFTAAKAMVGAVFYLSQPVSCAECDGGTISDKVVTVTAIDPSAAGSVVVECRLVRRHRGEDSGDDGDDGEPPGAKRPRCEDGPAATEVALCFAAPIASLEPLRGYEAGQYVYVVNPEQQVTAPRLMADLEAAVQALLLRSHVDTGKGVAAAIGSLSAAPVNPDTAYELLGVVNPPLWLGGESAGGDGDDDGAPTRALGPCAILRPRAAVSVVAARQHPGRRSHGHGNGRFTSTVKTARSTTTAGLVAVPFLFTVPDELTEAEGALDAAAQLRFEERLRAAVAARSEEQSLRNDEDAFHAQQQMGPVTAEARRLPRSALSVPVPLPTPAQVAAAKRRRLQMPDATAVTARIATAKDALAAKKEPLEVEGWLAAMKAQVARDDDVAALHLRSVQAKQQQPQQPRHHHLLGRH